MPTPLTPLAAAHPAPRTRRRLRAAAAELRVTLRGLGQIVLAPHAGCGALLLLGIAGAAPLAAIAAVAGALIASRVGRACGAPPGTRRDGRLGYNGALAGLAAALLAPTPGAVPIFVIGAALLAAVLQGALAGLRRPLTAPFVLVAAMLAGAGGALPALPPDPVGPLTVLLRGLGQIVLLPDAYTGAGLLAGLALAAPRAALRALAGAALGGALAAACGADPLGVQGGVWGFNAALAALALPGALRAGAAALLACALQALLSAAALPVFTAPFVLAVWAVTAWPVTPRD